MFSPVTKGVICALRGAGHALDVVGRSLECNPFVEKLQPSLRNVKFGNKSPAVQASFVAPCASVIGNVSIGSSSSVWYGAVIRGDTNVIKIGENVTVGDRVMIHVNAPQGKVDQPTMIGNNVQLRPGAIIHGAILEDGCFVGEGAQVMDGARVGKGSIVQPGSIVSSGKTIPEGEVWQGCPAKMLRKVTEADTLALEVQRHSNLELAVEHAMEQSKSWQEVLLTEEDKYQEDNRQPYYYQRLPREEWVRLYNEKDEEKHPGRLFNNKLSGIQNKGFRPE